MLTLFYHVNNNNSHLILKPTISGKDKTIPGRMCYVSRTETAVMICLVDIANINKGAEGNALDAFSYGIGQVKENGV